MLYFSNKVMLTSIENLSHVKGSNTNTIKSNSNNGDLQMTIVNGNKVAKAVFICHPSSHNFLDRTLILDKPIKIGRSVGHNKTSINNGIFDCKVLSRNHALLWFEDGKFLLRDTKSSNGTFVNTERLSKSNEESSPREVFSGDTVQFGVDVIENSRNVTHGCVIATLKLFLPNGREAHPIHLPFSTGDRHEVTLEDLYHLNQYLQESLQREQMLESKLNTLQMLMRTLRESTELSWKALISNNSLLSRVELLEVQLKCYSKKFAEDELREELRILQEDKNAFEGVVKQYFQKILDEKIEATQQCQDLNRALEDTKTEFANTQMMMSNYQTELRELASKNTRLEKCNEELEAKLQLTEEKNKEAVGKMIDENTLLCNQVKSLSETEEVLQQTIKELETHGDYAHKKVMSLQIQVEEAQKYHSDILCELVDPSVIKDKISDIELVKSWISVYMEALKKCEDKVVGIRKHVEELKNEKQSKRKKMLMLQSEMNRCAIRLHNYKEEQGEIETKITERKNEIEMFNPVPDILDELNEKRCHDNVLDLQEKKKLLNVVQRDINLTDDNFKELENLLKATQDDLRQISVSYTIEEDKLDLTEKQLENLKTVVRTLNEHVESLGTYEKEKICIEDVQSLKRQLSEAHEMAQEKQNITKKLIEHFSLFVSMINTKLNTLEDNLETMHVSAEDNLTEELELLKFESSRLVQAVNELQSGLDNLNSFVEAGKSIDLVNHQKKNTNVPAKMKSDLDKVTDMVILEEKCRSLVEEKLLIQNDFEKLKQQYESLRSYPYFDLYFILPFIVILSMCMFKYGDKLSFIFGTNE